MLGGDGQVLSEEEQRSERKAGEEEHTHNRLWVYTATKPEARARL